MSSKDDDDDVFYGRADLAATLTGHTGHRRAAGGVPESVMEFPLT